MIKHEHLLKYAVDEDDYPVYFYLCQPTPDHFWHKVTPLEVLYVPECIFREVADEFLVQMGDAAQHPLKIEGETETWLLRCLDKSWHQSEHQDVAQQITDFITKAHHLQMPHFIRFEGA